MMPMTMTITIMSTKKRGGQIHAHVQVDVPEIKSRAVIRMHFPAPANSNREDWADIAYDRALMMLDPA